MEVKVSVDGILRVVCGITVETTCQEVVTTLAQALGQAGRYMLRERFKDFERCMAPNECLLETLKKYGEQAREVQLTLLHNGPSVWDEMSRAKIGRHQPCPPLRRKEAGARMQTGTSSLSLHRQSLPPLSSVRQEAEQQQRDLKRPKRKSLSLMEEAWEWLETLGKGRVYNTACYTETSKKTDKRSHRTSLGVSLPVDEDNPGESSQGRVRGQTADLDHQTSCCMGTHTRIKESKHSKKAQGAKPDNQPYSSCATTEEEKNNLRETIIRQLGCLQDLQVQITRIDRDILELEERQRARTASQESQQKMTEDELEQIHFWENELKAEEGYERDLQCQFLDMRVKAVECKSRLQEYKCKMHGLDFGAQNIVKRDAKVLSEVGTNAASEISSVATKELNQQQSEPDGDVNITRKSLPRENINPHHALFHPNQIKERRPTGPSEVREWWTRWSETQSPKPQTKKTEVHRSELTIYLSSTKV